MILNFVVEQASRIASRVALWSCVAFVCLLVPVVQACANEEMAEIENILNSCNVDPVLGTVEIFFDQSNTLNFKFSSLYLITLNRVPIQEVDVTGRYGFIGFSCRSPGCIEIHTIPSQSSPYLQPTIAKRSGYNFPWCERDDFRLRAIHLLQSLSGGSE